jgi:hypothetical protein
VAGGTKAELVFNFPQIAAEENSQEVKREKPYTLLCSFYPCALCKKIFFSY